MASAVITVLAALSTLAGSEWGLGEPGKHQRFIGFKEDKVAGYAGCNRFFGSYTFDGKALTFGALGATRMMCSAPQMEKERELFRLLEATSSATVTHKTLILKDKNGVRLATLHRRDWD